MTIAAQSDWQNFTSLGGVEYGVHNAQMHKDRAHTVRNVAQSFPPHPHKVDAGYVLSLSQSAQNYLESEQEKSINRVASQLNLAAKIVSNSTTSDSQRLATISSAYHLFFMGNTLGAITGNFASAWGRFKAANSDSDFDKYFAVEKQFVPSVSPVVENGLQKNKTDMTGYSVTNRRSPSRESRHFEQIVSTEGKHHNDDLKETCYMGERKKASLCPVSDSLFSLMTLDEIIVKREKQDMARQRITNVKKEVALLKNLD